MIGKVFRFIYDALSSNWLALILLGFLLALTYLGTHDQVENGLFAAQQKYFYSPFLIHWFFGVLPVPLPGAFTVMLFLSINLILGGVIRMRLRWWKIGILVCHLGVVFLLLGSLVSFRSSQHGQLRLLTGETSDLIVSSEAWEVAVQKDGAGKEIIIPEERLRDLGEDRLAVFRSADLPFGLTFTGYLENCEPAVSRSTTPVLHQVGDFVLREQPREKNVGANIPGIKVMVAETAQTALLWGGSTAPYVVESGGERFGIELRRVQRYLPFQIRLEEFRQELYPGTGMPKAYESDVLQIEDEVSRPVKISMNEPLRHKGYTLYQSSFDRPSQRTGMRWMSVFSVVWNPADNLPLIATIIICLGVLAHFLIKLIRHQVAETGGKS